MLKNSRTVVLAVSLATVLALSCMGLVACGSSSDSSSSDSSSASQTDAEYTLVKKGTLCVATSPDYEPFEYQAGGEIRGFSISLIREIADRLDLKLSVDDQAFDSLIAQVASGERYDCAISSISITDGRAEQVSFSNPYYESNLAIVVLADSGITNREELNGQPVGAQSGSTGETWANENIASSEYTPFQEISDALDALCAGTIKAVVFDEPAAAAQIAGDYDGCAVIEVIATGEQYGIITSKDNPELTAAINEALAEIIADGTMDKLKAEWLED